jgi:hypothetical protein
METSYPFCEIDFIGKTGNNLPSQIVGNNQPSQVVLIIC